MALSISILKNILNFKCMHVNNCEIIETKVRAYGEIQVHKILKVDARPYKRLQGLCPKCKKKCSLNGIKQKEKSSWKAPNLNGSGKTVLMSVLRFRTEAVPSHRLKRLALFRFCQVWREFSVEL